MHKTIDVLLIDDCDADSKMTSAAVRRAAPSASLVRVKDGEQALRLMFHQGLFTQAPHVPRLVVLELKLPRASGRCVLERLCNDEDAPEIPVLVLTSSTDPHELFASYALGARECVVKPSDANEYLDRVAVAVQRHLH